MKSLAGFCAPFRIVGSETESKAGEFSVVVEKEQPALLIGENLELQPFWTVQISGADFVAPSDLNILRQILDLAPAVVLVNRDGQIQGVIHPDDVKDLWKTLQGQQMTIRKEFGEGLSSPLAGYPEVSVSIWSCPYPEHPPYVPYQIGAPVPDCPRCGLPREPQERMLR